MFRKAAAILLIPVFLVLTTGCWGKTELNEIGIVTVTGMDVEPDGSMRITVLSTQPEGSPNVPQMRSITWLGTATGVNLVDAAKNLRRTAVKKLSWVHNNIIIIGQEAAKKEMEEVVDFFTRNREIRFRSHILVAEGKAADLLQTPAKLQRDLYIEIEGLIRNLDDWSKSHAASAKDFLVSYAEYCGDLVTGKIWYTEEQMDPFSTAREDYEKFALKDQKLPVAYIEGCAVFRKGSLVGWLDAKETRGYLWITDKIKPGAIIAGGEGGSLAMENIFSSTSVDMKAENDGYRAIVKVDVRGSLMEQTSEENIRELDEIMKAEDSLAAIIRSDMEAAVGKMQKQYNTDAFRFGRLMNRQHPQEWKKIEKDWEDSVFSKLKVEYDIEVTVERTGMIIRSIV
jgi:spore germination protein KC